MNFKGHLNIHKRDGHELICVCVYIYISMHIQY